MSMIGLTLPGIERRCPPATEDTNNDSESSGSAEMNPFFLPKHLDHELLGYNNNNNVTAAPTATRGSTSSTTQQSSTTTIGYPPHAASIPAASYTATYSSVLPDPTMPMQSSAYALPTTCRSEAVNYQQQPPPSLEQFGEMHSAGHGQAFLPDPLTSYPSMSTSNAIMPLREEGLFMHQQHVLYEDNSAGIPRPEDMFADIPLPEDIVGGGDKTLTQLLTEVAREESKKPPRKEYSAKENWDAWRRYVEDVPEKGLQYIERHPTENLYCNMCDKAFDPGHAESQQHMRNLLNYGFTDAWVVFEGDDWVTGSWVIRPWAMPLEDMPQALMTQVPISPWLMAKVSAEEMNARGTVFSHQQAMASYYSSQPQHMAQPHTYSNVSTAYTLPDPISTYDAPDPLAGCSIPVPDPLANHEAHFPDTAFTHAAPRFNTPPVIPAVPMPDPLEGYDQKLEEQQQEEQRRVQQMQLRQQQQQQHAESLPDPLAGVTTGFTMPTSAVGIPGMSGGGAPSVPKSAPVKVSTGFRITTDDEGFRAVEDDYVVMGVRTGQYVGQNNGGVIKKERNEWVLNYRSVTVAVAPAEKDKKAPPITGWIHQSKPAPFKVSILIPDGKGGFLGAKR